MVTYSAPGLGKNQRVKVPNPPGSGLCHEVKATPHNSARKLSERFCASSKFQKRGNTVCISRFWNCRNGAEDPLRSADAIVRCCLKESWTSQECEARFFRISRMCFGAHHCLACISTERRIHKHPGCLPVPSVGCGHDRTLQTARYFLPISSKIKTNKFF